MADFVGIVLVSHSDQLASGLREVVRQVAGDAVPIEVAGGTDDGRIGTSYDLIAAALHRADRGAGVVVLTDLGSAVLTARAVLADRPDARVVLADAPFVEGAIAASVIAGTGADLDAVTAAAVEARDARKL
jgi:PTS hybrid protein